MKKIVAITLCLLLMLFVVTGCGGGGEQKTAQEPEIKNDNNDTDLMDKESQEAMEELGDALSLLATPGWPEGKIPDDIPEYPYGEVTNSGDGGDNDYFILISPTSKDELAEYLYLLEERGFTVSGDDEARLGTVSIHFQFNSKETLQMVVYDLGTTDWPEFIGDVLKPEKGTLYGEPYIPELTAEDNANGQYYTASFSLVDLTEDDCFEYIARHSENGWRESGDMAFKDITINGVDCELMLQFVQFYDGQADFLIEAWKK